LASSTTFPCSTLVSPCDARLDLTSSSVAGAGSSISVMAAFAAESDRPLPDSSATWLMNEAITRLDNALAASSLESG
jgi:hypothetical protein